MSIVNNTTKINELLEKINSLPTTSSGSDTFDATAQAKHILSGETAYVNGIKVIGTMPNNGSFVQTFDGVTQKYVEIPEGYISTGVVQLDETIPNAVTAAITAIESKGVAAPNNANVTDLARLITSIEAGGSSGDGLPSGVSALASGTYTPSSNRTTLAFVQHGLDVVPNFCIWMIENNVTSSVSMCQIMGSAFLKNTAYSSSSSYIYNVHYTFRGYTSNGYLGGTTTHMDSTSHFTSTYVPLWANDSYPLVAGCTYRWVCGVMDGIN